MQCIKHMDQQQDGGFNYFVVFGDKHAPWDAPDELSVQCATEDDADKLVKIMVTANVQLRGAPKARPSDRRERT